MLIIPLGDDVDHRDFPFGGVLLTVANVLVFAYMLRLALASPHGRELEQFVWAWALVPRELARGEYLGLVTHMFLHGGFIHIIGNMVCLWAFVHTLESSLGTVTLLVLYLLWGVAGGLAHAAFDWGSQIPMVGASGAIAGMMGAYWVAFGPMTKIRTLIYILVSTIRVDIPAGVFTGVWILMQLCGAIGAEEGQGGVAWFAHLGGFAAGAATMLVIGRRATARLVVNRSGELEFEPEPKQQAPAPRDGYPRFDETPAECPYCHTPLAEENRLAENLMRCPNPTCARCIYLEEALGT